MPRFVSLASERFFAQQRFEAAWEESLRKAQIEAQVSGLGVWSVWPAAIGALASLYEAQRQSKPRGALVNSTSEWECLYCGGLRAGGALSCQGCGAPRNHRNER